MSRKSRRFAWSGIGAFLVLGLHAIEARADLDIGRLILRDGSQSMQSSGGKVPLHPLSRREDGHLRLLVSGSSLDESERDDFYELRPGLYAWTATPSRVYDFARKHPAHRVTWSAPRKPLLDHALSNVRADIVHKDYGLTGRGVIVGIVDTGVDVRHPDLRTADAHSRISWLLDLSRQPTGKHPELEAQFACDNVDAGCAVFSGSDIDELLDNDISGDEPRDTYGHGTHVASLAAGNGQSNSPPRYVGVAPEASLVVVRATRDDEGYVDDADILLATKFIFAIAEKMGQPAVVNLSLGGDYGAHDGTSLIERELSSLIGPEHPGRSIVVAGGNSGQLYKSPNSAYPDPLGIHTTAQVSPYSMTRVPLLIGQSALPLSTSQVYLWIATRPGDDISVGLETADAKWIEPLAMGDSADAEKDGITAHIENGVSEAEDPSTIDHSGAFVFLEGAFERDTVLALKLKGHGTASIWVQPMGGVDPSYNGFGVLIPGAQREGTITVPASAPSLIAVGAALDRSEWTDVNGQSQTVSTVLTRYGVEGEVVPFSAAGPNAIDGIKPDLVAPGAYIVGAMSASTDPRTATGENGMFVGQNSVCSSATQSCLLVDDNHALSLGTSMASPVVAGAVALLLEKAPTLTQSEILRILQAGAKRIGSFYSTYTQVGAGALDVEGSLLALEERALGSTVSSSQSDLLLGVAYVRPDPDWTVAGMVHLRDNDDQFVDVDVSRLRLRVNHGKVTEPLSRKGPGYYQFALSGEKDSGGQTLRLELMVDGKLIAKAERPIAVDSSNVRSVALAGNRGCSVNTDPGYPSESRASILLFLLGLALPLRRRMSRELRRLG